ncbi:MAG: hypothetical protein WC082_01810 [Victivallales bacterium]|jgi:hypothetical protein
MKKIVLLLPVLSFLFGCISPEISYTDLSKAEELIISSGKEWEKHYKGQELKNYLSTFKPQKPTLTIVHTSQKGEIKINGYWYPVKYSEKKIAARPAIITIIVGKNKYIYIRQRTNKE